MSDSHAIPEPSAAQLSLRVAAGRVLGKLGDPRIDNGRTHGRVILSEAKDLVQKAEILRRSAAQNDTGLAIEFIEPVWCAVQAGPFTMGSDSGYDVEKPEHKCDVIKKDYAMGMFPVTNAEYDCFVKAGGYDNDDYWTPEGWAWRHQDIATAQPPAWVFWWRDWAKRNLDYIRGLPEENRLQPSDVKYYEDMSAQTDEELIADWRRRESNRGRACNPWRDDRDLNGANQPVVGVCGYEALAYCKWLTFVLRAVGRIRADQEVALPSEPEWEKAARFPSPSKGEGKGVRVYPWKGDFDPDRANTLEGRVLTTTPVGIYDNAGPCGALDLSGNVWEWTRSRWGDDPERVTFGYPYSKDFVERERPDTDDFRVVRGGSWAYEASYARVSYRFRSSPDGRYVSQGFRCVLRSIA